MRVTSWIRAAAATNSRYQARFRRSLHPPTRTDRWIEAKADSATTYFAETADAYKVARSTLGCAPSSTSQRPLDGRSCAIAQLSLPHDMQRLEREVRLPELSPPWRACLRAAEDRDVDAA
jgi:hypothetical protein